MVNYFGLIYFGLLAGSLKVPLETSIMLFKNQLVATQFNSSYPILTVDESCLENKLPSDIIEICLDDSQELSDDDKKKFSIILTNCQYQVLKLSLPYECELNDADKCIARLFEFPQYWISYDNNYKLLDLTCPLKINSKKMTELHNNISKHYEELNIKLSESLKEYQIFKTKITSMVYDEINKIVDIKLSEMNSDLEKIQNFQHDLILKNLKSLFMDIELMIINEKAGVYNTFQIQKLIIESNLIDLNNNITKINEMFLNKTERINDNLNYINNKIDLLSYWTKLLSLKNLNYILIFLLLLIKVFKYKESDQLLFKFSIIFAAFNFGKMIAKVIYFYYQN